MCGFNSFSELLVRNRHFLLIHVINQELNNGWRDNIEIDLMTADLLHFTSEQPCEVRATGGKNHTVALELSTIALDHEVNELLVIPHLLELVSLPGGEGS